MARLLGGGVVVDPCTPWVWALCVASQEGRSILRCHERWACGACDQVCMVLRRVRLDVGACLPRRPWLFQRLAGASAVEYGNWMRWLHGGRAMPCACNIRHCEDECTVWQWTLYGGILGQLQSSRCDACICTCAW